MDTNGLVYIIVTTAEYPLRVAFKVLKRIQEDVQLKHLNKALICPEVILIKSHDKYGQLILNINMLEWIK